MNDYKITMLLIVSNGGDFYQKWINHYQNCKDIYKLVIVNGFTKKWFDAGLSCRLQPVIYNKDKTLIHSSIDLYDEKLEQQNKGMSLIPRDTDYVWIADVDEFYNYNDISYIRNQLNTHKYTYVEFFMNHFWKTLNTVGYGGDGFAYETPIARIFKYYNNALFKDHRPVTLLDSNGIDMKAINPLLASNNPVKTFHYGFIDDILVEEKIKYYSKVWNWDFYNNWFLKVYSKWTIENKEEIENIYSVHPTIPDTKTRFVQIEHPISFEIKKYQNNLIYYTSIGKEYADLTNISIYTLLTSGCYRGDVIVLCDTIFKENNLYNVKTINIENQLKDINPVFARTICSPLINSEQYSQIMYLDSDIEVLGDINPLFKADNNLLYCIERHTQGSFPFKGLSTSSAFTEDEYKEYFNNRLINSGTYCVDSKIFKDFINKWEDLIESQETKWGIDQSTLNLLVYRNLVQNDVYNEELINFIQVPPQKISPNAILQHYLGKNKQIMIDKYRHILK